MAPSEAIIQSFGHVHDIVSIVADIFACCLFIHLKAASHASHSMNKCLLV